MVELEREKNIDKASFSNLQCLHTNYFQYITLSERKYEVNIDMNSVPAHVCSVLTQLGVC